MALWFKLNSIRRNRKSTKTMHEGNLPTGKLRDALEACGLEPLSVRRRKWQYSNSYNEIKQ